VRCSLNMLVAQLSSNTALVLWGAWLCSRLRLGAILGLSDALLPEATPAVLLLITQGTWAQVGPMKCTPGLRSCARMYRRTLAIEVECTTHPCVVVPPHGIQWPGAWGPASCLKNASVPHTGHRSAHVSMMLAGTLGLTEPSVVQFCKNSVHTAVAAWVVVVR
jgi:hypothetical protein